VLRRAASVALLTLALLPLGSASASERRSLCADRTALWDSPGGFVIGHLFRPQKVAVLLRDLRGRWAFVEVATGTQGWILSRTLCKPKSKRSRR
jgi:hypothetical protein